MKITAEMRDLAFKFVEASSHADDELSRHFALNNIRDDGTRIDGPDYSMLDHASTRANHFYSELTKLVPNPDDRTALIYSALSKLP